ncbi:MAG: methyltransferase domain-containing protein [Candidatus Thermoplasmatota archaeon]|nr:methyltransferase domain-containing protein [Candidatus Thermoplasmatota archaeon]
MREKYLLELGGENTDLGKCEALELFKFEKYSPRLELDYGNIIIISTSRVIEKKIINRLSMTKRLSNIIFTSTENNNKNILNNLEKINIGDKSFAIRQIGQNDLDSEKTSILIGEKISAKNKTNLNNPEITVLFYQNSKFFISLCNNDWDTGYKKCLQHHISHRPYFSPISIHPRIARAMVNLSNCDETGPLIDPFCGTGGILIEAADMGMEVIGIDLKEKMVEYSKGNLRHYGFEGKLINSDFEEINKQKFSSIVCDPPYGIASTSGGETIEGLMGRSLDVFQRKLRKRQRLVIAVSNPNIIRHTNLQLLYKFEWYIHKSLTRNIIVLEKN